MAPSGISLRRYLVMALVVGIDHDARGGSRAERRRSLIVPRYPVIAALVGSALLLLGQDVLLRRQSFDERHLDRFTVRLERAVGST